MAVSAPTAWEVRPATGSANNGGGFDSSLGGVDYSLQAAAQLSLTDLACANNTTLTSVTGGFTAAMLGNYWHLTSGTNITPGFYRVVAFASANSVTLDRNPTTGANASAGVGALGGALASTATIAAVVTSGNTVYLVGTLSTASGLTCAVSGGDGKPVSFIGYAVTRGDGAQATVKATGAMTALFNFSGDRMIVRNLTFDGNSLASFAGQFSGANARVDNCWGKGATQNGLYFTNIDYCCTRSLGTGCGSSGAHAGIRANTYAGLFDRCAARANGGNGFSIVFGSAQCVNCIASGNTLSGFYVDGGINGVRLLHCTSYGNTLDGLRLNGTSVMDAALIRDNIFAANAGYGVRSITTDYSGVAAEAFEFAGNAYYANTLGARYQVPTGATEIALTADPFNNAAGLDFSLNLSIGGGLSVRGKGQPGGYGLRSSPETSVGTEDVGAVPTSGAGTGAIGTARSLFREYTGERSSTVLPDATVDIYLQAGLEAMNRRLQYRWTDDSTSIVLVAGTQEYTLPSDCIYIQWVAWNGRELKKRDVDAWRNDGIDWRNERAGEPQEWAHYRDRIVFRPAPSAAAVSAAASPVFRYNSTPPAIGTSGQDQLNTQDMRLCVLYAVAEYSYAQPGASVGGLERGQGMLQEFETEVALVVPQYQNRRTAR